MARLHWHLFTPMYTLRSYFRYTGVLTIAHWYHGGGNGAANQVSPVLKGHAPTAVQSGTDKPSC